MSPKVRWDVVRAAAGIDKLAPHDLRRTYARLCHLAGGELDQSALRDMPLSSQRLATSSPKPARARRRRSGMVGVVIHPIAPQFFSTGMNATLA
jgi:integrase